MLNVQMLGGLSLFHDRRRVSLDIGLSGRMLMGYLFAFPGRPHRRDRLVDRFWTNAEPDRARGALNTAVWRLRKTLSLEPASNGGINLISHGNEIVLESAPWLSVDTHEFDRSMRSALPDSSLDEAQVTRLEGALATYAGPFLDGEDADWILAERERLHSLYIRGLGELIRNYALSGQVEKAISATRRVLVVDRFRESVQRQHMLLLVINGQRGEAIRHFSRWKGALEEEFAIKPMPQTLALAEAISSGTVIEAAKTWVAREFMQGDLGHQA